MRTEYNELEKIIAPVVESLGLEFVGSERASMGKSPVLRVYIDGPNGVSLDQCGKVSQQIDAVLEVESSVRETYTLEVSSPGLDRILFTVEQLAKQVGNQVKLKLYSAIDGRKNFKGLLTSADEEKCVLNINGTEVVFYFDDIDEARLVLDF